MRPTILCLSAIIAFNLGASFASAQDLGALGQYERYSHDRWHQNHRRMHGEMGPIRKFLHRARNAYDTFDHGVRQFVGDPNVPYYTRHDRRGVGLMGPPSGMMNQANGYNMGYGGMNQGTMNSGAATDNPESLRFLNRRAPVQRDPRSGLYW